MGRKENRRIGILPVLFVVSILLLAAVLGYTLFRESGHVKKEPIFQYVSMSEEAAARAYIWLNQIENMPLTYGEIREMMGEIRLTILLTPTAEKGRYTQTLAEGTVRECLEQAQSGLEQAYRAVVRHRFSLAGHEGEITDAALDDMMRDAYGVTVAEYLAQCEVQLLPTFEELAESYSGEVSHE